MRMLLQIGHTRDFCGWLTGVTRYKNTSLKKGYALLLHSWESFFTRRMFDRIQDCWNRPICSPPRSHIEVMERGSKDSKRTMELTGRVIPALNTGSYNYLGFADDWKTSCGEEVLGTLSKWPINMSSARSDMGSIVLHEELEKIVADFLGKEAAVVYQMGFGTNLTTVPALMGPGTLIISDSLNHTSIVNGARSSPALIRVFKHNNPDQLELILKESIVNGQPCGRPWTKILVMVEGIYSMEGHICRLPEIVRVCKKYKAYLYVDEAHSIGALGATGRGVCELTGVDPADVDILMGTFTKVS